MNKVNYSKNRRYRDLIIDDKKESVASSPEPIQTVTELKEKRKSKFDNFKRMFKNILKK
jgi:hypothetical protein